MDDRIEYHYVLTLQGTLDGALGTVTADGLYTPATANTRADAYREIVEHVIQQRRIRKADVLFFSLERNGLAAPTPNGARQ